MIRVEVQPYCENCRVFEADVEKPVVSYEKVIDPINLGGVTTVVHQTDTVVRCVRRNQCENIKRFLERQEKEKADG